MINGRVPLSALVEVQSGIWLEPSTAAAWSRMVAAASAERVILAVALGGGYRDMAAQRKLYKAGSASGIAVAEPGKQSHGLGTRLDVAGFTGVRKTWVQANAPRFGFSFEFGSKDPNHLAYTGTQPSQEEETAMKPELWYANVDGVPSWAWVNWATGAVFAAHTQADADYINSYMKSGSAMQFTSAEYKARLVMLKNLNPTSSTTVSGLTQAEHDQLFNIPTKPETAALHTAQTGDINTHTTDAVNGITLTAAP